MNLQQIKPGRDKDFQEAVLDGARSRAAAIVEAAEKKKEAELALAYQQCELADYAVIKAERTREVQRKASAALQQGKAELLRHRQSLAGEIFAEARARLQAFAESDGYAEWLRARLQPYAAQLPPGALPVVYLCARDLPLAPQIEKVLPGCQVQAGADIQLGGARLAAGNRLFDETLDTALAAEEQEFFARSGLRL
ncbi:MAG: V-type ATP synthase subunit E family protein [Oscillospiraceae bacterium]